jgi:hypothetical protein
MKTIAKLQSNLLKRQHSSNILLFIHRPSAFGMPYMVFGSNETDNSLKRRISTCGSANEGMRS